MEGEGSLSIIENLQYIQAKIEQACQRSQRDPTEIKIIAVTKYVSVETTKAAIHAGISDIGENRDDGLLLKWEELGSDVNWHFIGTLQSRKVKNIIDKVGYIHSLDRKSLAKEINKRAERKMSCFVQVNASGEESKHGLKLENVVPFIKDLKDFSNIEVVGLMTMAPYTEDEQSLRKTFKAVRALQQDVQALQLRYAPCKELSMGMSNDFEIAIEEGATFIRIGTSLVGKEF
jgi:pyridoxal phosphate enzyme (YggS family)